MIRLKSMEALRFCVRAIWTSPSSAAPKRWLVRLSAEKVWSTFIVVPVKFGLRPRSKCINRFLPHSGRRLSQNPTDLLFYWYKSPPLRHTSHIGGDFLWQNDWDGAPSRL